MDVFKTYFQKLCAMLRRRGHARHEAEDLVQEAFVRLLSYVDRGEKVAEPEAFLAKTVFNLSVDRVRRARVHLYDDREVEELAVASQTGDPETEAHNQQCLQRTQAILDEELGERVRRVFFLHCFEGLTYEEIAKQINMSRRTVEKDLAKAINLLAVKSLPPP